MAHNMDEVAKKKMGAKCNRPAYVCTFCPSKYSKSCNLSKHMKDKHNFFTRKEKSKLICPMCLTRKEATYKEIETHLKVDHNLCIENEKHEFDSKDAFQKWKERIETKSISYFKMQRTRKVNQNKYVQYVCHRSGVFNSNVKGSRKRQMKVQGTNKIGVSCPARIDVTEKQTGQICILYTKTHVGHQNEIQRTRLIKSKKEEIAEKLLRGIPNHVILKHIGKTFNPDDRMSYTTSRDIRNIKKAFNIQPIQADVIFYPDDSKSVDLVSMNSGQKEMLNKDGNNENNNDGKELKVCKELLRKNNRHKLEKCKELFQKQITSLTIAINQCQSVEVISRVNETLSSLLSSTQVSYKHHHQLTPVENKAPNKNNDPQLESLDNMKEEKEEVLLVIIE